MAFPIHYYNQQIKKYLIQFMAIFSGLQVEIGKNDSREEGLIPVPIHYGSKDRVAASIIADNTQNKPIRLPTLSTYLNTISLAPELRKGIGAVRRQSYLPRGGVLPDDVTVVHQIMPIPYKLTTELAIYTSNMDEHFQILEQILMVFDPILQIQTNDSAFDWTKITTVELTDIRPEENYPPGTNKRMSISTLSFQFPIYIAAPANLRTDFVKDIFARISAIDMSASTSTSDNNLPGSDWESQWNIQASVNQSIYRPGMYSGIQLAKTNEKISQIKRMPHHGIHSTRIEYICFLPRHISAGSSLGRRPHRKNSNAQSGQRQAKTNQFPKPIQPMTVARIMKIFQSK